MKTIPLSILLATALMAGCGDKRDAAENEKQTDEAASSDARQVVESVTGIKSLRSGRKAEDQVRQIQADYNRKMQEALDETN